MSPLPLFLLILLGLVLATFMLRRKHWQKALADEAKNKREALAQEREQHQLETAHLIDALQDGVLTVSQKGRILRANKKARSLLGDRPLEDRTLEETLLEAALIEPIQAALRSRLGATERITLPLGSLPGTSAGHSGESHWLLQISPLKTDANAHALLVLLRVKLHHLLQLVVRLFDSIGFRIPDKYRL